MEFVSLQRHFLPGMDPNWIFPTRIQQTLILKLYLALIMICDTLLVGISTNLELQNTEFQLSFRFVCIYDFLNLK